MSALVKKEIRQLLPGFVLGLLLAFSVWLMPARSVTDFRLVLAALPYLCCPAVMLMMMLDSFGHELSAGTFSLLLSQPVPRQRIWRVKTLLLALAALLIWLVWCSCYFLHNPDQSKPAELRELFIGFGLFVLVIYSGGLWTVLLFRQVAAAFWFTILVPAILVVTLAGLVENHPDNVRFNALTGVLTLYGLAGFVLARWLFLRAQDVVWTGGTVSFSAWRYLAAASRTPAQTRHRQPIAALLKKELQMHGISLFCAVVLLALHLVVILFRNFGYANFVKNPTTSIISECFWLLWLFMPVIVGSTAVSEERKLGVMEGQLCLPVSRRVQFLIKFLLTLLLGVLLGSMPVLVEGIACRFGVRIPIFKEPVHDPASFAPYGLIPAGALVLSLAAFFASTLTRSFLQALGLTIATITGCFLFMRFATEEPMTSVCSPLLLILIALPVVPTTLAWLAYLNFKNYLAGWRLWGRNLLGLAGAMGFVVVTGAALYHRAWEVFEPMEPPHGSPKLTLTNPPTLRSEWNYNVMVRLPDGRIWFDGLRRSSWTFWQILLGPLPENVGPKRFIAGSNWVSATVCHIDTWVSKDGSETNRIHVSGYLPTVGIQSDGSLWSASPSDPQVWPGDQLARFGDETNWQQLIRARNDVLLLKTDGTLWRWGTNHINWNKWQTNWPNLRTDTLHQVGTNSDWKEICSFWGYLARKADGSVWRVSLNDKSGEDELRRETNLDEAVFKTLSLSGNGENAYVRPDGTLWMSWDYAQNGNYIYSGFVRVGMETNWTAVALNWKKMVALKSDGSLWQWQLSHPWNISREQIILAAQAPPTRLGIHNDWVAIAGTWDDVIGLAADGSLWLWPNHELYERSILLKLPKQPQLLGNVFGREN